jgi:hypothetical protein
MAKPEGQRTRVVTFAVASEVNNETPRIAGVRIRHEPTNQVPFKQNCQVLHGN